MSKVTSKLQVTVPKEIADRYGIRPGSDLEWVPAGETLRVLPNAAAPVTGDVDASAERLRLFDAATARQKKREAKHPVKRAKNRGWKREDLYDRALPR